MRVGPHEDEGTLPGAVERRVLARGDDPVPVEVVEVDGERVAAAEPVRAELIAVTVDRATSPGRGTSCSYVHLNVRRLKQQQQH